MNWKDEKERNEKIRKLVDYFKKIGIFIEKNDLDEMMRRDDFHNKHQTEDQYLKEQDAWLKKIRDKKK